MILRDLAVLGSSGTVHGCQGAEAQASKRLEATMRVTAIENPIGSAAFDRMGLSEPS
jgi:hypothetical protein